MQGLGARSDRTSVGTFRRKNIRERRLAAAIAAFKPIVSSLIVVAKHPRSLEAEVYTRKYQTNLDKNYHHGFCCRNRLRRCSRCILRTTDYPLRCQTPGSNIYFRAALVLLRSASIAVEQVLLEHWESRSTRAVLSQR